MIKRQKITYGWVVVTLAVVAGVLTVALTGVAFWLSYEHLHDVAGEHGLVATSARSWAWPATLDTFIVIGELLVLRASLLGRVDKFAVFLAAAGSAGSITLNVVGVGGAAGTLDYVVAGVPPVAALLAFAALMRQVHGAVKRYLAVSAPVSVPPVPASQPKAPAPQRPTQARPRPSQPKASQPVSLVHPGRVSLTHPGRTSQPLPRRKPRASQGLVPPAPDPGQDLLTTSQAAGLAGVPASTIRTWKQRGKKGQRLVPTIEDPDVLYSRETVTKFLEATK